MIKMKFYEHLIINQHYASDHTLRDYIKSCSYKGWGLWEEWKEWGKHDKRTDGTG